MRNSISFMQGSEPDYDQRPTIVRLECRKQPLVASLGDLGHVRRLMDDLRDSSLLSEVCKTQTKPNDIKILNPVLEMASLASLLSIASSDLTITMMIMKDEREACKGPLWHPNHFVGVSGASDPKTDSQDFRKLLRSMQSDKMTRRISRPVVSASERLPMSRSPLSKLKDRSPGPIVSSLFFSNMTWLDLLLGAVDFYWVSSASPFLSAAIVHFVGHSGSPSRSGTARGSAMIKRRRSGSS
ncbi:hypothetical protein BD324DRAFT_612071 [Kockovaella imperatae]|uniref:Uncharacterized protein n=1 Tax=Kockovaella imperatae TaxID=4999 RepID=A0A1Y1UUB7_9TREE|nr:hypothetical protein BD324DRAFT_612071 [Kockovaella imperatae]ORX40775.1 hypothetical protein BD324DRAFT_612071 [Kockovaella imperatae]